MRTPSLQEAREATLDALGGRPVWMTVLMIFCAYMALIYLPWDIFVKPVAEDAEVWFGITFRGWAAKAAEPFHWFVYGAGAYGFLKMRSWMWPWASLYVLQVAFSMFVWPLLEDRGGSIVPGAIVGCIFLALAYMLWRGRDLFGPGPEEVGEDVPQEDGED